MNYLIIILNAVVIFDVISIARGVYVNDDILNTLLMNQQELKKIIRKRFKNVEDETTSMKIDLTEIKASIEILSDKVDQISKNYDAENFHFVTIEKQNHDVPEVSNLVLLSDVPEIKILKIDEQEIQNKKFKDGQTINLHCKVHIEQNDSWTDIKWLKNDEMLSDSIYSKGDYEINASHSSNEIQSVLQLINIHQNHSGSYNCLSNGIISKDIDIIVIDTVVEVRNIREKILDLSDLLRKMNDTVLVGQQQLQEMFNKFENVMNSSSSSKIELNSNSSELHSYYEPDIEINFTADYSQVFGRETSDNGTRDTLEDEFSDFIEIPKCNTTNEDSKEKQIQELINNQTHLRSTVNKYSQKLKAIKKHLLEEKKHHCAHPFVWLNEAQICIYFSISKMSWDSSRLACKSLDSRSDLAVIPDPMTVRTYMMASKLHNYFYFIGATDRGTPGYFHWIDGSPVTSGWDTNEPHNNVPGHNCLWIYKYGYIGDVGHDLGCNIDHYRFICQK